MSITDSIIGIEFFFSFKAAQNNHDDILETLLKKSSTALFKPTVESIEPKKYSKTIHDLKMCNAIGTEYIIQKRCICKV